MDIRGIFELMSSAQFYIELGSSEEGGNGNSITQKEYDLHAPFSASTVVEIVEITTLLKCIHKSCRNTNVAYITKSYFQII